MKMELRDIEYFAVVAARGNVGRAADELGLSQPALSKSLRRLERAVGARLVNRTPKGVDLTAVGSALFARARGLRLSLDAIMREASDLSQGRAGHLRIGTGPGLALDLMPGACARLLRDTPGVTLRVTVGTGDILLPALGRGELDLTVTAILLSDHDDVVQERLLDEEFVVYASARHRLARKDQVSLADIAQERWALGTSSSSQQGLRQAFAETGLPPPRVAVETSSVPFRLQLLPATELLSFGPRRLLQEGASRRRLVELRVKGLSSVRSVSVCYRKEAYLSPAARRFIEILKKTAKEIAKEQT